MEENNGTFECSGKLNLNDFHLNRSSLILQGELDKVINSRNTYLDDDDEEIWIFGEAVQIQSIFNELKHFTKQMQMGLKVLDRFRRYDNTSQNQRTNERDYFKLRKQVNEFLVHIRRSLNNLKPEMFNQYLYVKLLEDLDSLIATTGKFLTGLKEIIDSMLHVTVSNIGNKSNQPEFHLYHLHLEIRWLVISFNYTRAAKWNGYESLVEDLDRTISLVIHDLVYIALKTFERSNLADLRQKSPFSCTCVRELWLMLQLFIERVQLEPIKLKSFWNYLNQTLDSQILKSKKEPMKDWFGDDEVNLPDCKHPELFSIWVAYHLALLNGYNSEGIFLGASSNRVMPNFDQMEKILKSFANTCGKDIRDDVDDELKLMIPMLKVLTEDWWHYNTMVINYLWQCFNRRLELPFILQSSGPWSIPVDKKTPVDILKQITDRINHNLDQNKESSFGMFLTLLASVLKRSFERGDDKCWQTIQSRIRTRFQKNKVNEFNESALYNFISLFLTFAVTTDPIKTCPIMVDLLPEVHLIDEKQSRRANLVWKSLLGVLIIYMERNLNLETIAKKIFEVVNEICSKKDDTSKALMSSFVETLSSQFKSKKSFVHGEHLLIEEVTYLDQKRRLSWVNRYMAECPVSKTILLLQMFSDVLEKYSLDQSDKTILDVLWCHVAGKVRVLAQQTSECFEEVANLGADFTIGALRNPEIAKIYSHSAPNLFQHFTNIYSVQDARVIKSFLSKILSRPDVVSRLKTAMKSEGTRKIDFDVQVIQAWAKCCIHGQDADDGEMRRIKSYLVELEVFKMLFPSTMETQHFRDSKESILLFVMAFAKKRNSLLANQKANFDANVKFIFTNLDKWVLRPISNENKDSRLSLWIYKCLGHIIFCCGPMFSSQNILAPFIRKFALPTQPNMGFLKHLAKTIFSKIILGLENTNAKSLVGELFNAYVPMLVTQQTGGFGFKVDEDLLKCFIEAKSEFVGFIFERVCVEFFKVQNKSTHDNCHLIMVVFSHLLKNNLCPRFNVEFIVDKCLKKIIYCFTQVHERHSFREQTSTLIADLLVYIQRKKDVKLSKKFTDVILSVLKELGLSKLKGTFQLLQSIFQSAQKLKIDNEIIEPIKSWLKNHAEDSKKNNQLNAESLRFAIGELLDLVKSAR